jgi:hypothetical protein
MPRTCQSGRDGGEQRASAGASARARTRSNVDSSMAGLGAVSCRQLHDTDAVRRKNESLRGLGFNRMIREEDAAPAFEWNLATPRREVAGDPERAACETEPAGLFVGPTSHGIQRAVRERRMRAAQRQQRTMPFQQLAMGRALPLLPIEMRALERLRRLRIGRQLSAREPRAERALSTLANRLGEPRIGVIGEVEKWRSGAPRITRPCATACGGRGSAFVRCCRGPQIGARSLLRSAPRALRGGVLSSPGSRSGGRRGPGAIHRDFG